MILVRANEILAVASVSEQGNHVVAVETVDASNKLNDDGLDDRRGISHFIPHVVAIPNPRKDADYIPQDFGTGCKLVNDGAMSRLAHIDMWSDNSHQKLVQNAYNYVLILKITNTSNF
jgi:hypothetical protein